LMLKSGHLLFYRWGLLGLMKNMISYENIFSTSKNRKNAIQGSVNMIRAYLRYSKNRFKLLFIGLL